jgi:hypothetical protein
MRDDMHVHGAVVANALHVQEDEENAMTHHLRDQWDSSSQDQWWSHPITMSKRTRRTRCPTTCETNGTVRRKINGGRSRAWQ